MKAIRLDTKTDNALDRAIAYVAPSWAANRAKARAALTHVRKFDGASNSARVSNWRPGELSGRAETQAALPTLRARSHALVRNNPYAAKGINVIRNHIVGKGIRPQFRRRSAAPAAADDAQIQQVEQSFAAWFGSTACDYSAKQTGYALQALWAKTIAESGSVLIRKIRVPQFNSAIPLPPIKLQTLEPDYLDRSKDKDLPNGGYISNGKEYDAAGRLTQYHIFNRHPGDGGSTPVSSPVSVSDIIHIYRVERPGDTDGYPWLTPVLIKMRDFDDLEDAFLFRQKIANMHVAFIYDSDPSAAYTADQIDGLEPGAVEILPPGKDIKFNDPPKADGSDKFRQHTIMAIATGLGITYESLSGDYSNVNFSSARMGAVEMHKNVIGWQHHMFIPQGLQPIADWFLESLGVISENEFSDIYSEWTPPRREMTDASREVPPIIEAVRAGLQSPQEAIRQHGYEPEEVLADWQAFMQSLDDKELILDIDPRKTTATGRPVSASEDLDITANNTAGADNG